MRVSRSTIGSIAHRDGWIRTSDPLLPKRNDIVASDCDGPLYAPGKGYLSGHVAPLLRRFATGGFHDVSKQGAASLEVTQILEGTSAATTSAAKPVRFPVPPRESRCLG